MVVRGALVTAVLIKLSRTSIEYSSMRAILNGTVIAESDDIVMVDGNPYFPRSAMRTEYFRESTTARSAAGRGLLLLGCRLRRAGDQ